MSRCLDMSLRVVLAPCAREATGQTRRVLRVYKFRLYPTRAQEAALFDLLGLLRRLYNAALEERITAYRRQGHSITKAEQERALTEIKRTCPEYAPVHTHLLQDVTTRLDRAFKVFFRRCKEGKRGGFPRFKGRDRYATFTFKDAGKGNGAAFVAGGKRVRLHGIGNVKVKVHRAMEGTLKTLGVTRDGDGQWYLIATREVEGKPLATTGSVVGLDLGLTHFFATSEGQVVTNPRPLGTARLAVERAQRTVSRRQRGSKRRAKARALLAKQHARARNARKDFHHKVARRLVAENDGIAVEDLNVKGLARSMLARSVNDSGWGQFVAILGAKAEEAGRSLARVDPAGTSQQCSACGREVRKGLAVRVHRCPCGLVMDRDVNAARNVLQRAFPAGAGPGHGLRGAAPHGGHAHA